MNDRIFAAMALTLLLGASAGCGGEPKREAQTRSDVAPATATAAALTLTSPAFREGEPIPARHACTGANLSPELNWSNPPEGVAAWALVCHDPDAPVGDWVHWVIYDLPGQTQALPEGMPDSPELENGARQGRTDFGRPGYGGPCPPPGKPHRYLFELYALKEPTGLGAGATRDQLLTAIRDKIISQAVLTGNFKR